MLLPIRANLCQATKRMSNSQRLLRMLAVALCILGTQLAHAHTYLLSSQPAAGDVYTVAPQRFVLHFQTPVESRFSHYVLVHQRNTTPLNPDHPTDSTRSSISGPLPFLKVGAYLLRWSVMARDGHRQEGSIPFEVR